MTKSRYPCKSINCDRTVASTQDEDFCDACRNQRVPSVSIAAGALSDYAASTRDIEPPSVGFVDRLETHAAHSHYYKNVSHLQTVDVYRVLQLFNVTDPCLQHLTKKALSAGNRGHKDRRRDLEDIQDSVTRALEMMDEDECPTGCEDLESIADGDQYA